MRLHALAAALLVAATVLVHGQAFPVKPVRIVVPFPPGDCADSLARIMQPALSGL